MKHIIPAFFVVLFCTLSCNNPDHYILKGNLDAYMDEMIYLSSADRGGMQKVDSCIMVNGSFEFKPGRIEYPQIYYLSVDGNRGSFAFYIENSVISFTGHIDTLHHLKVSGSETNNEYRDYNNMIAPYYEKNSELFELYHEALENENTLLAEKLSNDRENLFEDLHKFQFDYVKSNPGSWITPLVLRSISYLMEEEELRDALNALDKSLEICTEVKEMEDRLESLKNVRIGETAPDFLQNNTDDEGVRLSELEGYKYLLIDFWAAWCGPCRKESPLIVEAYSLYNKKGFDILGVSLDNSRDEWLKVIEEDGLEWTQVSDLKHWDNEVARLYCVSSIPNNYLLDEEGVIIAKGLSGEELLEKLNELLGE